MIDLLSGIVIGLHVASVHVPSDVGQHNLNPGVYARTESGLTAGIYHNSLGRTSVYAGYTFERGPFALGLGAITGYQRKAVNCVSRPVGRPFSTDLRALSAGPVVETRCGVAGSSGGAIAPALSPSVALPSIEGFTPRLTVIPRIGRVSPGTVFHLSLERKF